MGKAERREALMCVYLDIAEDQDAPHMAKVHAVTAYLNRDEGMPVQKNVNMNVKKDIKDFSDDELLAIAGASEDAGAGGDPSENAGAE
jgi:hypothetical protein